VRNEAESCSAQQRSNTSPRACNGLFVQIKVTDSQSTKGREAGTIQDCTERLPVCVVAPMAPYVKRLHRTMLDGGKDLCYTVQMHVHNE
jgi:hypothetical protein